MEETAIVDPMYGSVRLSEKEKRVLDNERVQRLRNVRQLGLSDVVYPGATHSRLEHSLGVMHLAGKLAESAGLDEEIVQSARMAGLLHDVGHGPYSHVSEMVAQENGLSHEDISCEVIRELSDIIPADVETVIEMVRGNFKPRIVAGTIDADRMDYLRRDSHRTGVKHGEVDTETIVRFAEETEVGEELVFDGSATQSLESFLSARMHMTRSVYRHHATRIAEKMCQRALQSLVSHIGLQPMMRMDDCEAAHHLKNLDSGWSEVFSKVSDRKLYRRALVLTEKDISKQRLRSLSQSCDEKRLERQIADEAGVSRVKVLVDKPYIPTGKNLDVQVRYYGDRVNLSDISSIPSSIQLDWREVTLDVFADRSVKDEVERAAMDVLQS